MSRPVYRASAHDIVDFALMGGDIIPGVSGAAMQRGSEIHRDIQTMLPPGMQPEVPVALRLSGEYVDLQIGGRMDGYDAEKAHVLEIKTMHAPVEALEGPFPEHLAQAVIYAEYARREHQAEKVLIEILYVQAQAPDERRSMELTFGAEEIEEEFAALAQPYLAMLDARHQHLSQRNALLQGLAFPYADFRSFQRDMSVHGFTAFKQHKKLFLHAPTGTGKTIGTLYGAMKALALDHIDRIFFLTARGTGRLQPLRELANMELRHCHVVAITAKDKCCVMEERNCLECERAKGYYDRVGGVLASLGEGGIWDQEGIAALADAHSLCPFELSLDMSIACGDIIVADYNYFFAPGVTLQRFFEGRSKAGLLIDEAHQLESRARDMYSAELRRAEIRHFRSSFGKRYGRKNTLYAELGELLGTVIDIPKEGRERELPADFRAALGRVCGALEYLAMEDPSEENSEFLIKLRGVLQLTKLWDEHFSVLYQPGGRMTFTLLTPHALLQKKMKKTGGCVLFSGTLQPLEAYAKMLGKAEGDACLALPSPFPPENQQTRIVPLDMRYQAREGEIPRLAGLLYRMAKKPGNYLICFPSYTFMRQVCECEACEGLSISMQESSMNDAQRADFLAQIQPADEEARFFFVVMGGLFTESVDLPGGLLQGIVIVGLGLPQVGPLRDAIAEAYEESLGDGFFYGYVLPGISRVIQAAGRLIRSPEDRGFVLLCDMRFGWRRYRELLPSHWQIGQMRL